MVTKDPIPAPRSTERTQDHKPQIPTLQNQLSTTQFTPHTARLLRQLTSNDQGCPLLISGNIGETGVIRLYQNYEGISNLLVRGLQWDLVLMLVPLDLEIGDPSLDFPGFIADYELIAEAMKSHDLDGALSSETLLKETDTLEEFFAKVGSDQRAAEATSKQAGIPKPSKSEKIFGSWD